MRISYNWLHNYLPEKTDPEKLSKILTSIGLEVESMEKYEQVKGSLNGLVIGEVLTCEKHPGADRLHVTSVHIGNKETLQIVCGAANVAAGQKVVVALSGATIYPVTGEPLTLKQVKIRGVESNGMICAEDEIGLGNSHDGIMVLDAAAIPGTPAAEHFKPYTDYVYEIGLTPNRMDAMSHLGVARDVCAWLSHHNNKNIKPVQPFQAIKAEGPAAPVVKVSVKDNTACPRYSGLVITNIKVEPSPDWLQQYLSTIGLRPLNNIVDITNFILHETGQPLHAFDLDKIADREIIVQNLPAETPFITLDEKERKLTATDLMICDAEKPMCIGGVFGGLNSGVTETTTAIFLESACFSPASIRKTSMHHGLRTDAAIRFEKGTDISQTVQAARRAAQLIRDIAGGQWDGNLTDIYPQPAEKKQVSVRYHYLKKISGKNYHPDAVKGILDNLGFEILKEGIDELRVAAPYYKPDITLPADIAEEILRIDGLDSIDIPDSIRLTPGIGGNYGTQLKEKMAQALAGMGFTEIVCNSITNSKYYSEDELASAVKMMNSLSSELDIMRPAMLEPQLEVISYNINRKNTDLKLFEFGNTYAVAKDGTYREQQHLSICITGNQLGAHWQQKPVPVNIFYAKGIAMQLLGLCGINNAQLTQDSENSDTNFTISAGKKKVGQIQTVSEYRRKQFDIEQPVYWINLAFDGIHDLVSDIKINYQPVARYMPVQRDISMIIERQIPYEQVALELRSAAVPGLVDINLFDVFESDKLGDGKKSMAIRFTFQNEEKTFTEKEIETAMQKIRNRLESKLQAEIRK